MQKKTRICKEKDMVSAWPKLLGLGISISVLNHATAFLHQTRRAQIKQVQVPSAAKAIKTKPDKFKMRCANMGGFPKIKLFVTCGQKFRTYTLVGKSSPPAPERPGPGCVHRSRQQCPHRQSPFDWRCSWWVGNNFRDPVGNNQGWFTMI